VIRSWLVLSFIALGGHVADLPDLVGGEAPDIPDQLMSLVGGRAAIFFTASGASADIELEAFTEAIADPWRSACSSSARSNGWRRRPSTTMIW
jgi:hypothetical protein